ncbi:Transmembrane osmosensor [Chytriomyces hyalinus]|nr:Transmembrane osmosensor [Chytriomyces hyalinus]
MPFDRTKVMHVPTLASGALAILGWFLMFVGVCIEGSTGVIAFHLFYLLVVILGVLAAIGFGQAKDHRVAIVAFIAIGFTFLVSTTDAAVGASKAVSSVAKFTKDAPSAAAYNCIAAGGVFMCFVFLYWIVTFGSGETSPVSVMSESTGSNNAGGFSLPLPVISFKKRDVPVEKGLEGSAPETNFATYESGVAAGSPQYASYNTPAGEFASVPSSAAPPSLSAASPPPPVPVANPSPVIVSKARALYAYTANAADPKEISFPKGVILDITDNKGKWWYARYVNDEGKMVEGIVPSNYLEKL